MGASGKWDLLWSHLEKVVADDLDLEIWRNLEIYVPFRGRSLLELGCGRALQSRFAIEAGAISATLVDNSPEALRLARSTFAGVRAVSFVQQDLLEYRSQERFDIVLSSGTVEHFRGESLLHCLRVHAEHARGLVVIVTPSTPHYNEFQCRTRRFVDTFGYERPISTRRMKRLLSAVGLRPLVLRRFFPLYNLRAYWSLPRSGISRLDRWLDYRLMTLDTWVEQKQLRRQIIPYFRRFDRVLGGLLLAVAERNASPGLGVRRAAPSPGT